MPTTVTKSIGSAGGRDYSTIQAWEDALPASLVTADTIQIGEIYNDSEFTVAGQTTIGGETTDATRYIALTVTAGQSFQDNANVRTNALKYNASNGAAIRRTSNYGSAFVVNANYTRLIRLQIKHGGNPTGFGLDATATNIILKYLIVEALNTAIVFKSSGGVGVNLIAINRGTAGDGMAIQDGATVFNATVIRPSDISAAGVGLSGGYAASQVQSSAIFGFSTAMSAAYNWTTANCKNNATNLASGLHGSGNQHSVTYSSTSPFVGATNAATDARLANDGNALINNGLYDGTNVPDDISLATRNNPPEIGAWELVTAAATNLIAWFRVTRPRQDLYIQD